MIWFLIQKIGFFIFLSLTIWYVYRKEYTNLLILYFWGMAFAQCYQFYITIWHPTKIISIGMLCLLIVDYNKWRYRNSVFSKPVYYLTLLTLLAIVLGDFIAFAFPGKYAPHISKLSRILNINISYIIAFALLYFRKLLDPSDKSKIINSYCLAVEVAIAFGLIHFIFISAGMEFMPILRHDGSFNVEAIAQIGGQNVARVYGVTGEPKGLGFLICPYIMVLTINFEYERFRFNNLKYHVIALITAVFILINTYSSAVLINFACMLPVLYYFVSIKKTVRKFFGIIYLFTFALLITAFISEFNPDIRSSPNYNLIENLYERSFVRARSEMQGERQERKVLDTFISEENLLFNFLGYGPSQYTFHVENQTVGKNLIPLQSGFVLSLVDFGILGIILLIYLFRLILILISTSKRENNIYALSFSIATLSSFVGSLTYGMMASCFPYLLLTLYFLENDEELDELPVCI